MGEPIFLLDPFEERKALGNTLRYQLKNVPLEPLGCRSFDGGVSDEFVDFRPLRPGEEGMGTRIAKRL